MPASQRTKPMSTPEFIQFDSTGIPIAALKPVSNAGSKFRSKPPYVDIAVQAAQMTREADAAREAREAYYRNRPEPPIDAIPEYRGTYSSRMQEWSYLRTPNRATNPAKFYANKLNETHAAFLADEIDVEQYMLEVIAHLEHDHEHIDVIAFIATIQSTLESGSFCPEDARPKFATRLNTAWEAHQRNNGVSPAPTERQGQQEGPAPKLSDIEGTNKLAGLKKDAMKERLEKAFENLKKGVAGAEHEFYTPAYKFVLGKVSNRMWNTRGECATTEQDVANNILWEVSKSVEKIEDIYSHLCKAAWNQGSKAFTENNEHRDTHEPLIVEVEEEDGTYKEDNPLIHLNELRPIFRRALPPFIQGDNLAICGYIREDYDYAKIAKIMSMTLPAIKQRVAWMRNRIAEMKAAGEL
jgi:hypothetical protein